MSEESGGQTAQLASFLAGLRFEDIPRVVVERTEDLFVDWVASAFAGADAAPVRVLRRFSDMMGPSDGPSEVVGTRAGSSPLFAALVNGAASHVVEQDDLHNGSVFHPGTVVFPALLAAAQQVGSSGKEVIVAAVAGYEAGVRVGRFLGRSHYRVFHTTGTAGTLAAGAAVASILGADPEVMLQTLGSAGTQAAGLWEFLRDAADSKQLHTAKAAADGLLAAYIARDGFTGARRILEGAQGMGAGMSTDSDPTRLTAGLGAAWAVTETSFKVHASCRHTHPAADALLKVIEDHKLSADQMVRVRVHVHQAALDVLGSGVEARTIHQAKFSMGFVLALIALHGRAGITAFTEDALGDERLRAFADRVEMVFDREIDAAYPERWIGKVAVETKDGTWLTAQVDVPRGDPGNTLSRTELADKAQRLAAFGGSVSSEQMTKIMDRLWTLDRQPNLRNLLATT